MWSQKEQPEIAFMEHCRNKKFVCKASIKNAIRDRFDIQKELSCSFLSKARIELESCVMLSDIMIK